MCGIVAAAAGSNIVNVLIEGLKKLEYRGYDSAGIAVIGSQQIERVRSVGRVAELEKASAITQANTAGVFGVEAANALAHVDYIFFSPAAPVAMPGLPAANGWKALPPHLAMSINL